MEKKYNYTYQIKNLINGKTYIGVHSTDDLNDGYMGSGIRLKQSIYKHGKENFVKTIMCFFDTADEAYEEEVFLVDEKWIQRKDTYNISLGGNGGNLGDEVNEKISEALKGENNGMYGKKGIIPPNKGISKYDNIKHLVKEDIKNGISQSQIQKKYNISKGGVYRISLELK